MRICAWQIETQHQAPIHIIFVASRKWSANDRQMTAQRAEAAMAKQRKKTLKSFHHAAGAASARMGLRHICWVSIQVPDVDCEVTAYVNFKTMQVLPWNNQSYMVREAMNQFAYNWTCWWVLEMNNGMGSFYKFAELPVPHKRNLRDILRPVAAKGQELTEKERLDHITARGAVFTISGHQFTDEQLDTLFTLVRQQGTPVDELAPAG